MTSLLKSGPAAVVVVVVATTLLLLPLLGMVQGQNYHYSNGWHPGKRDGASSNNNNNNNNDDFCRFRPQIYSFINKLIKEEIRRIERSCFPVDTMGNFKAPWEQTEQIPVGRKVGEEENKW